MRPIVTVIALLATMFAAAQARADSESPAPVHTRKSQFRIPYRYDPEEMKRLGAKEVRLYVSVDRGANWRHAESVPPSAGRFEFLASGEGEYWFSVRTLDGGNRLHPPGDAHQPGLKVVVDYTPPEFHIAVRQVEPGRVELSWRADDLHLDTRTLRLEYLQAGSRQWQPVSVIPQAAGRTSWSVPQGGMVAVRGSIGDKASNTARAEQQAQIVPAAGPAIPPSRTSHFDEPVAERHGTHGQLSGAASAGVPFIGPAFPDVASAGDASRELPYIIGGLSGSAGEVRGRFASSRRDVQPAVVDSERPETESDESGIRIVNSDSFDIDYEIGDVGPSGVGAVEFYITRDGGRKWYKLGDDLDRRSPYQVKVPGDGAYGFEIRVRSGVGLAADPPQPGEAPSIVVVVDQTPPVVQLHPIEQGQGASLNKITIRWKAEDANPAARSVLLAYAAGPDGPWTTIRDWSADDGGYQWSVTSDVPPSLYVALSVRDAAGNIRREVTPQPIVVDLKKPSAKIIGVKPPAKIERR